MVYKEHNTSSVWFANVLFDIIIKVLSSDLISVFFERRPLSRALIPVYSNFIFVAFFPSSLVSFRFVFGHFAVSFAVPFTQKLGSCLGCILAFVISVFGRLMLMLQCNGITEHQLSIIVLLAAAIHTYCTLSIAALLLLCVPRSTWFIAFSFFFFAHFVISLVAP